MKVKFSTTINSITTGKPLQIAEGDAKRDCTLGYASMEALMAFDPQVKESGEEKARSYALAIRIAKANGEDIEITAEEVVLLKKKIGENFAPAVVGPAYEILEQRVAGEA